MSIFGVTFPKIIFCLKIGEQFSQKELLKLRLCEAKRRKRTNLLGCGCEVSWTPWSQVNPQKMAWDFSLLVVPNRRALPTTPEWSPGSASQQSQQMCSPGASQHMDSIPKCWPLTSQKNLPLPRWGFTWGSLFEIHEEANQHSRGAFFGEMSFLQN